MWKSNEKKTIIVRSHMKSWTTEQKPTTTLHQEKKSIPPVKHADGSITFWQALENWLALRPDVEENLILLQELCISVVV